MTSIYDYTNNIKISKSQKDGTYIIRMNDAILVDIENSIHEGADHQKQDNRKSTAEMTMKLWQALFNKHEQADSHKITGFSHVRRAIDDITFLTDAEKVELIEMISRK